MTLTLCALALCMAGAQSHRLVVAYVPNWIDLTAFTATIDYSKLTHIDVAFENPINAVGELSFNASEKALIDKAHANHVKVLVSIGGGGASQDAALVKRYFDLQSDSKRADFVAKLCAYVQLHQFDGLDVDLEGPGVGPDYGAFIDDLSKALLPKGLLLTAAVSQWYGGDKIPNTVFDKFSFVNLMAYDATGPWAPDRPGPHSSLEYAKGTVAYWLGRGLPKSKAVLGVPFYGYGFGKAFRKDGYTFSEIVTKYPGAEKVDQIGETIYYNGVPTIKAKAKYIRDQGLAGAMIWSLDSDGKGAASLLSALCAGLNR